jgi:hypothetical protein
LGKDRGLDSLVRIREGRKRTDQHIPMSPPP